MLLLGAPLDVLTVLTVMTESCGLAALSSMSSALCLPLTMARGGGVGRAIVKTIIVPESEAMGLISEWRMVVVKDGVRRVVSKLKNVMLGIMG